MKTIIWLILPLVGTSLGAFLGTQQRNNKTEVQEDAMVAIATGILGTISINLTFEAFEYIRNISFFIGLLFGIMFILVINKITSRETMHAKIFWAMVIHNIPEGMITGIALTGALKNLGIITSISLQNIPDGLIVSLATLSRKKKYHSLMLGILSGIVEPIAAVIVLLLAQNVNINIIEPIFIGFAIYAIYSIELDLLKNCKNIKLLFISFIFTTIFNLILG